MFQIPHSMLAYWNGDNKPKASAADIARIEQAIGAALPAPYVEFVTEFGFVVFGRDREQRYHFDYLVTLPDRKEVREGNIRFLHPADGLLMAYDNLTTAEFEGDEQTPCFPSTYLPVGNDAGQGQILLEIGEQAGRVWYWPYNEWAWGTRTNTWLGFVAGNFYEFINKLRP
jgi:hypothetical protein